MGKQQKLKAQRRAIRARRKQEAEEAMKKALVNPPDLGVAVKEDIKMTDKFGG